MARQKLDGIIEAVRYAPDGQIALARIYERRGAVWSDHTLLKREELVTRLKSGKRLVAGRRKPYLGGIFETSKTIVFRSGGQGTIVTEDQSSGKDSLADVPVF